MAGNRTANMRTPQRAVAPAWRGAAFIVLFAVPSFLELGLANRKFGVFTGGFGASRTLDTPIEWAAFAPLLLLGNLLFAAAVAWIVVKLHRRRWNGLLFVFNLGLLVPGILVALIVARYEVMRYISDAMSFRVMRDLGGGSMTDALLYILAGQGLAIALAAAAIVFAAWAMRWAARRDAPASRRLYRVSRRWRIAFAAGLVALVPLMAIADRIGDTRFVAERFVTLAAVRGVLDLATDFDRDGYGVFGLTRDPAPFDAARYPFALDIPDNGRDEDGIGGDFTAVVAPHPHARLALPAQPKNLVIVVIESMRGDVLGMRVHGKVVAPNLEALARQGSHFPAYSHVGFTTASLKSLFTGEIAPTHPGASLFPLLKRTGYRVAVFSGQPESFGGIAAVTGMRAAADPMVDAHVLQDQRAGAFAAEGSLLVDEKRLLAAYDARLGKAPTDRPLFAYFNFQSPHFPYWHDGMENLVEPSPLSRSAITDGTDRATLARTYYNAVAWSDAALGALITRLKASGQWDNTVLLVVGDHGESLLDDGFLGHGHMLNDSQTRTVAVTNVRGVEGKFAGLWDLRDLLVDILSNRPPRLPERPVLQHIGDLDTPARIGLVDASGRIGYNPERGTWSFDGGHSELTDDALNRTQKRRARALIDLWSNARWQAHRKTPTSAPD
ncbi:sulfatase-like hydrolase/transferase [Sphingorhabdus soli]|uniref:Sulfatase-like hydrolase/transferase n=2 Tax=Flavisphingopyxis soli TaxID=2601267 RepID=A0A5C6UQ75_9SPHN|nr:sulfatase-like hydrolase/transferase [Sphingorhabdus soli]